MKLNTVFNRLGEVNIQNYFISKEAIEIIKLMSDEQLHHPNKLRECISSHYTHLELLRNKKIRELLLENMRPDELKKLLPRLTNTSINENNVYKEMEYFFCDTGAELPETYTYLKKLEAVLGKPIARLNSQRGFDHYFEVFRGTLPSPQMRWCTKLLKIKPLEEWIGDDETVSYVAIRADEKNRKGHISSKPNITTRFLITTLEFFYFLIVLDVYNVMKYILVICSDGVIVHHSLILLFQLLLY